MAYPINNFQQTVGAGLGTWSYTVLVESIHRLSVFSTYPSPSGLIITVNQNGSPINATSAPGSLQTESSVESLIPCQVGDVLTVVLTSADASDSIFAKTIINLHQGN